MVEVNRIIDYVEKVLPPVLENNGWVNMNNAPSVGRLKEKFAVFGRIAPFKSVITVTPDGGFEEYTSLRNLRSKCRGAFVVGYDSEWVDLHGDEGFNKEWRRFILSWQFSFLKDDKLFEIVFVAKNDKKRLSLSDALAVVFTIFCSGDTQLSFKANVEPGKGEWFPVCLLCHCGLVDLTAFEKKSIFPMMKSLHSVQKGIVSMVGLKLKSCLLHRKYRNHRRYYPLMVNIRDTMCFAPAGHRSLDELGAAIGYHKVTLSGNWISKMDELLMTDPCLYMKYAVTDASVTLLYIYSLFGANTLPTITLTSATASVMQDTLQQYFGTDDMNQFNAVYRGLRKVSDGTVAIDNRGGIPYLQVTRLEPLSVDGKIIQYISSMAYHGGYNGCSAVGYFDFPTYDYDLKNAYPTAMVLVPDVDWQNPIKKEYSNFNLAEIAGEIFKEDTPMTLFYALVDSFEFQPSVAFPCLPVMVDGIPIYPFNYNYRDKSCSNVGRVYVTGVELYLAHKLGAKVICEKGYLLNALYGTDAEGNSVEAKSLSEAVIQMIRDRNQAKEYAKTKNISNYLCDTILKNMVNSQYGKVAQDVRAKKCWDAEEKAMLDIGPSKITNPVSASFITAIVRCVLIAAENQCVGAGYKVFSVTTDGFISNAPEDALKNMDLFGFRQLLYGARMFLTDGVSGEIWEKKHEQMKLLNFTTRGNVAPTVGGVCAHCGAKSSFPSGSVEDRMWLIDAVLRRTGRIEVKETMWATFKEYVLEKISDFFVYERTKNLSMDFDMKRKPDPSSFKTNYPVIQGKGYEILNFNTIPFADVAEYKLFKGVKDDVTSGKKGNTGQALRTLYDWNQHFFPVVVRRKQKADNTAKINVGNSNTASAHRYRKKAVGRIESRINETKIRNCLYAHYAGEISIPLLDSSVQDFCIALNKCGLTQRRYVVENFKNYKKQSRWPAPLGSGDKYMIDKFLKEQEPVLSILMGGLKATAS